MKYKKLKILYIFVLFAVITLPILPLAAQNGYYRYRSTVTGTGATKTGEYSYKLNQEKEFFTTSEPVYVLTRIFNITDVEYFSFKYNIRGENYDREFVTQSFTPHKRWWAEIWYWKDLGAFPAGYYEIDVAISVNGDYYKHVDRKTINVGNINIPNFPNSYCYDCSYNYDFQSLQTGKGIRQTGTYTYDMANLSANFRNNENVFALTKLGNIRGIKNFQVKHEIYDSNGRLYRSITAQMNYPNGGIWEYNNTWANFGPLGIGNYEVRSYVNIDGRGFVQLGNRKITISQYGSSTSNDYNYNYDYNYYDNQQYYQQPMYSYSWSQMDTNINSLGNYQYSISNPKEKFKSDERITILTKLEAIRGISRFQIRHELYATGGKVIATNDSPVRSPQNSNWDYNYNWSDFGPQTPGTYYIRVLISINGGSYTLLDTRNIEVVTSHYDLPSTGIIDGQSYYYNYYGSQTGTGISGYYN